MDKNCIICGDILIRENETIKKHESLGLRTSICQDCLSIPIRCTKSTMTLSEILHRIRVIRGAH
ncbi:MAG: hypothetical protein EAX96_08310 [Candidatus Lokiarchaeota archaeon]|nr:hypothetical protein [Candidatus Lokiarchaeota archaeon]